MGNVIEENYCESWIGKTEIRKEKFNSWFLWQLHTSLYWEKGSRQKEKRGTWERRGEKAFVETEV